MRLTKNVACVVATMAVLAAILFVVNRGIDAGMCAVWFSISGSTAASCE